MEPATRREREEDLKAKSRTAPAAENGSQAIRIVRIRLDGLFGLYAYDIPAPSHELGRTPILYGENGLGKTNILKILFHLLSPAGNRGHRTALGEIKFRSVDVFLSNAIVVSAKRLGESLAGALRLEVGRKAAGNKQELLGAWNWYPKGDPARETAFQLWSHLDPALFQTISEKTSQKDRAKALESAFLSYVQKERDPLEGEEAFLRSLRENVPPLYFLTAERTLSSDQVELDQLAQAQAELHAARRMRPEEMVEMGRQRALNEAITMASRRLSQLGVLAARQGTTSMHAIYHDLIRRLASRAKSKTRKTSEALTELTRRLIELSARYGLYAKYGLAPELQGESLVKLLEDVRTSEQSVASLVLKPYIESLTEQAKTFSKAYDVIDTLVGTVNEFLYDKSLEFSLVEGMRVRNRLGSVLQPKDLSSGEQQLLLLFCHITIAHDSGGIFIIDEPEISLNIKWQRKLIDSLLRLDSAKNLQFVLASHSMELLTRHREDVVPLIEASKR